MSDTIHIIGGGAVGAPLAAFLTHAGRKVILHRTSITTISGNKTTKIHGESGTLSVEIEERSFSDEESLDGWAAITTKAHANVHVARKLAARNFAGPIVILQNGIGVERPFIEAGFTRLLRAVLYLTSERTGYRCFSFRCPRASPLGPVSGEAELLDRAVDLLSVRQMPFAKDPWIERSIWRKTIINAVFNSICTLTGRNNHLFVESEDAMSLARSIVTECVALASKKGIPLDPDSLIDDIQMISRHSTQLISTLQDVRAGRPTEMNFLNLALARLASQSIPPVDLSLTSALGHLVMLKANDRVDREV